MPSAQYCNIGSCRTKRSSQRSAAFLGEPPQFEGLERIQNEVELIMYFHRVRSSTTGYDPSLLPLRLETLGLRTFYLIPSGPKPSYLPPSRTISYGCTTALAVRLYHLFR